MLNRENRILQYDVLRVIAAFGVVLLHTSVQRYFDCFPSVEWSVRNFYDSIVRWPVPVFIMISGALFLNSQKKLLIKKLYTKNILRIVYVYLFWSIIYALYDGIDKGVVDFVSRILFGPFHFWFLKMLIGLYITIPILRAIVTHKKTEEYFIILALVTAFVIPMLLVLSEEFSGFINEIFEHYNNEIGVKIALGYVGYFVLGHYLSNYSLNEIYRKFVYLLGGLSLAAVCVLTQILSNRTGEPYMFYYEYLNVFTLFESIAVFILVKDMNISSSIKIKSMLLSGSKCSLGIYIIHPLVLKICYDSFGINSASISPLLFIPIFSFAVFVLSYFVSLMLIMIPIINKIVS